jgi:NTE family protein
MRYRRTPEVAFVLSGGASLGAIQVGMLQALYERGIAPDVIVGTSAGALNGAFIASRPQTVATAEALAGVWRDLRRGQVFPLNPFTGLLGFLGARSHLVPESGLRRLVGRHLERERLEDLPIPLHVVAVDVLTGDEVRLSGGPVLEAVLASAAIPAVLPPVEWDGRTLMDGGVANNTPISHAVDLGARRVYVLPTGHACALEEPPSGALAMALHALSLLTHRRLVEDIERHRGEVELVVLPPPCPLGIQPIDFGHAEELVERALSDARRFLAADSRGADSDMQVRDGHRDCRRARQGGAVADPAAERPGRPGSRPGAQSRPRRRPAGRRQRAGRP